MAARESAVVAAAVADVLRGMTRADAAAKHGVAPSSITRAMQRRDVPPGQRGRRPHVGLPMPEPLR